MLFRSDSWKGVLRDDGKDALPGSTADQSSVSVASGLLRVAWQLRQRGGPSPTQHLWAGLRQLCSFLVCTAAAGGGLTRGLTCFFDDLVDVGNLISGSSAFSNPA